MRTFKDVDRAGEVSTESEMAASHLVARCTHHDIDFSLRSIIWHQFCENQKLGVLTNDPDAAMMLAADTIDGISAELELPVAELALLGTERQMAAGVSIEQTVRGAISNVRNIVGSEFVARRSQCAAAKKYLYKSHKCFTLMTEYENQLGAHMRMYEDLHNEMFMYKDYNRLIGSRFLYTK